MESAVAVLPATVVFRDRLGERRHGTDASGLPVEFLVLREDLARTPAFEAALRARVQRFEGPDRQSFGSIRGVERTNGTLAIMSRPVDGIRLSRLLQLVEAHRVTLDIDTAIGLVRQFLPSIALLHEEMPDAPHGAIGADRLVLTDEAEVVFVDHVLGGALDQLGYPPERYWRDLGIPVPPGMVAFDTRTDVMQLGVVVLSLVLGRALTAEEGLTHLSEIVASAWAISSSGGLEPLPPGLRSWLTRALQLDSRNAFQSAIEAQAEFDSTIRGSHDISGPLAVELFLAQCRAALAADLPPSVLTPLPSSSELQKVDARKESRGSDESVTDDRHHEPAPHEIEHKSPRQDVDSSWLNPQTDEDEDEAEKGNAGMPKTMLRRRSSRVAPIAAFVVVVGAVAVFAGWKYLAASTVAPPMGTLVVNTNPQGAAVAVDGQPRGVAPVSIRVNAGPHTLELGSGPQPRKVSVMVAAGAEVAQYFELPAAPVVWSQLQIVTEPAGARVTVDAMMRGTSPLTVTDLTPGPHSVVVESDLGSVKQQVTTEAGTTTSLVLPLTPAPGVPVSGWIAVHAPLDMQLFENGKLLGTSSSDRIMVSAGKHEIEILNEPLVFRSMRSIQVSPGKVTTMNVDLPKQKIAINAVPWAEVSVDGQRVGETPIGDYLLTVGPHDFVFRHPTLGERRKTLTVTAAAPARVSMDLRN